MFKTTPYKSILTDLPLITEGYWVLHYDEEPILFTGFNKFGNRILASSVEKNYEWKYELFFYLIIDDETYFAFTHQKISYQKILADNKTFFLIKSAFDESTNEVFLISYSEIPQEYIPLQDSFCPEHEYLTSLDYFLKLSGGNSNNHKADPDDLNILTSSFKDILKDSFNTLPHSNLIPKLAVEAYQVSSFKIKFNVELIPAKKSKSQLTILESPDTYKDFIKNYLDYAINQLNSDAESISKKENYSNQLNGIIEQAKEITTKLGYEKIDTDFETKFIEQIQKSATELKDIAQTLGTSYTSVQLSNSSSNGSENIIGIINENFKVNIEASVEQFESVSKTITKDESPQDYKILVYHLNTATRSGNAIIPKPNSDEVSKPKLKITGEEQIEGSMFTESLHFNRYITVKAIATRDGDTIKSLTVEFK